jgi:hypothetical protein
LKFEITNSFDSAACLIEITEPPTSNAINKIDQDLPLKMARQITTGKISSIFKLGKYPITAAPSQSAVPTASNR